MTERTALMRLMTAASLMCEYHHLPLQKGWLHRIQRGTTTKIIQCRIHSKDVREAITEARAVLDAPAPPVVTSRLLAETEEGWTYECELLDGRTVKMSVPR